MVFDISLFTLSELAGLVLLSAEYLAYQLQRPFFHPSDLRLMVGFSGLDHWIGHAAVDRGPDLGSGSLNRLFSVLAQIQSGLELNGLGLKVPAWSHFHKCKYINYF